MNQNSFFVRKYYDFFFFKKCNIIFRLVETFLLLHVFATITATVVTFF